MDTLAQDRNVLEKTLCERARFYAQPDKFRTITVFDRERDERLLIDEGWDGYKRIHSLWVHIELREGLFWIQEDGTQDGIANDLMAAGVPEYRIVLAFRRSIAREKSHALELTLA